MNLSLRPQPYPYEAMLAICSDLDETPDASTYFETCRFLNTRQETRMGQGVGLEVGNTIYFAMPREQFSYYNADDRDRERIHDLIRSGHIDCLHSFGDLVDKREEVIAAWDALDAHGCRIEVWIDHGTAKSNFDAGIMFGEGATPGAACFHADVSIGRGIKYVWKGRVTSVIAKDAPVSLKAIFRREHPVESAKTIAREAAKIALARLGSPKYRMHCEPDIMRNTRLESGHEVIEFIRSNPSWGSVSHNETADGIHEVLTEAVLDQLVAQRGTTIIYTHLGKTRGSLPIPVKSAEAFRLLGRYAEQGRILVATTRRLLGFRHALRSVHWTASQSGSQLSIEISTESCTSDDLAGLCWYVPETVREATATIDGGEYLPMVRNAPDATGKPSVSIPWARLEFPE